VQLAKAYNLKANTVTVAGEEFQVIQLGEEGRGRSLVRVPCPVGVTDPHEVTLTTSTSRNLPSASLAKTT
jgi:hypothetical protein